MDSFYPKGIYDKQTAKWVSLNFFSNQNNEEKKENDDLNILKIGNNKIKLNLISNKKELPPDLIGAYRFGVTFNDIKYYPEKLREILSFKYANQDEINNFRIHSAIKKWQEKPGDTGSTKVQIAVLTEKILYLAEHFKKNKQDKHSFRGFIILINRRRKLLKYLKKNDVASYFKVIKELNLSEI